MSNIEKTLLLLCKQIHLCTGVNITPQDFYSVKCNSTTKEIVNNLWLILYILSRYAVTSVNPATNFLYYDNIVATKLQFGYLNYSDTEFYSIPNNSCEDPRLLLIALAWLIARYDILNIIIKKKITVIFGHEFIAENKKQCPVKEPRNEVTSKEETLFSTLELSDKINEIIKKCMKINYNLKDIAELMSEKTRLVSKIHAATSNICDLPHLSVCELKLIKNYCINSGKYSDDDIQMINKLNNAAAMIKSYVKWVKCSKHFFNWMIIINGDRKSDNKSINIDELSTFISTVRHVTKKKIIALESDEIMNNNEGNMNNLIASRFIRTKEPSTNAEECYKRMVEQLKIKQSELAKKIDEMNFTIQTLL